MHFRARPAARAAERTEDSNMTITLQDVCWLRQAALKRGTQAIPTDIAKKLVNAQLIRMDEGHSCMRITKRGEIALARLG